MNQCTYFHNQSRYIFIISIWYQRLTNFSAFFLDFASSNSPWVLRSLLSSLIPSCFSWFNFSISSPSYHFLSLSSSLSFDLVFSEIRAFNLSFRVFLSSDLVYFANLSFFSCSISPRLNIFFLIADGSESILCDLESSCCWSLWQSVLPLQLRSCWTCSRHRSSCFRC